MPSDRTQTRTRALDQRIKLFSAVEALNSFREVQTVYTEVAEVWGSVESLDGADILKAQTFITHLNVKIVIRYYPGLDSSYRVEWEDTVFNITEVLPIGRKKFHSMVASEAKG